MKKVLITSPTYLKFSSLPLELFKNECYEVNWIKKATHDQLLENIIDVLLVRLEKVMCCCCNRQATQRKSMTR